jgi:hypothetical protein
VSSVDLFPTIVQLGVGSPLSNQAMVDSSGIPIDGRSIADGQRAIVSVYAFSAYPRCDNISTKFSWQCVVSYAPCTRRPNIYMGYAVRTFDTKYVEWRPFRDVIVSCARPDTPFLSGHLASVSRRIKPVRQIDANASGTIWERTPVQREMFDDYPNQPSFAYGVWEADNVLVTHVGNGTQIAKAYELSAAIRWRFDSSFGAGGTSQPCSGNGWVRLITPSFWQTFVIGKQPSRADVRCECLSGWKGAECNMLAVG